MNTEAILCTLGSLSDQFDVKLGRMQDGDGNPISEAPAIDIWIEEQKSPDSVGPFGPDPDVRRRDRHFGRHPRSQSITRAMVTLRTDESYLVRGQTVVPDVPISDPPTAFTTTGHEGEVQNRYDNIGDAITAMVDLAEQLRDQQIQ